MSESLEATPANPIPASPSSSLLRRLFSLHSIGFYLMILLALIGAAYTFSDADGSRWYWQRLIPPVFGLICIIIQWPEPNLRRREARDQPGLVMWSQRFLRPGQPSSRIVRPSDPETAASLQDSISLT